MAGDSDFKFCKQVDRSKSIKMNNCAIYEIIYFTTISRIYSGTSARKFVRMRSDLPFLSYIV